MQTKTIHEEEIVKEIRDLPQPIQKKLTKVVHFLKEEIIRSEINEESATDEFLSVCGEWEDDRNINEQLSDIYSARNSTNRTEKIF